LIRVIIIAPAMAIRAGLRALASEDPAIQVIAEGASMNDLEPSQLDVDVVVWSPSTGMELQAWQTDLRNICIVEGAALLVVQNDPQIMQQLVGLTIRAWGVLDPEASQAELTASIHALNEGLAVVDPLWLKQSLQVMGNKIIDKGQELIEPLTERETAVLQLLAFGLTNKQIAARLKISAHTVKFHVSSIFTKLGTTNRVETVNLGLKKGLIVL
jgi:NarL family two-component system response regulator YdfI